MICQECSDIVEANPTGLCVHCAELKKLEAKAIISDINRAFNWSQTK